MKTSKINSAVFAVIMLYALPSFALSQNVNGVVWQYTVSNRKATIGGIPEYATSEPTSSTAIPSSTSGAITIPSQLGGYTVTAIGDFSFQTCTKLTSVKIPSSITSIGDRAFKGCSGMTSVTIGSGVTSIGSSAFSGCSNLSSVTIPNYVTRIGDSAFYGCSKLSSVTIGTRVTTIDSSAFRDCTALTSITIPNSVTSIGFYTFYNCKSLKGIVVPNSVQYIGDSAFGNCTALKSMTLPFIGYTRGKTTTKDATLGYIFGESSESATAIHYLATQRYLNDYGYEKTFTFKMPKGLSSITVTDGTTLGYAALCGCSSLTSITLPDSITSIGSYAFYGCSGLKQIKIPLGVNALSSVVLGDCSSLNTAYLPKSFIGNLPANFSYFVKSPNLQIAYYDETMKFFEERLTTSDNSSKSLVAGCSNGCRVSFKWKCSCEPILKGKVYDFLSFLIDGVQQDLICGETDWQSKSYEVTGSGDHEFRWTYQKDAEGSAGEDCGWIKQVVVAPRMTISFSGGEGTDGASPDEISFYADDDGVTLPGCSTLTKAKHTFSGWSDGVNTYQPGKVITSTEILNGETQISLTAVWVANTLSLPTIVAPETYEAESTSVSITAGNGASIYYTVDGSSPTVNSLAYNGAFNVVGSATIRAIAVKENYFDSGVATFNVTRLPWTFEECLNCPDLVFGTSGNATWRRAKDESVDGYALRSGSIGDNQTSRLDTVVYGSGTISFRCKVEGEVVKSVAYDGLAFCIDGVQQGDLMGKEYFGTKSFAVTGNGRHTLSWLYVKDEEGKGDGRDCAWLDKVVWTPAPDPIPELPSTATADEVAAALGGSADTKLSANITDAANYAAYREWALGVKTADGSAVAGAEAVKNAANAWFSYALNTAALIAAAPKEGDLKIGGFTQGSSAGVFDLSVSISGITVGDNATAANLKKVFGVEGAGLLDESEFKEENVNIEFGKPDGGKMKIKATPKNPAAKQFFMRVKMK